MTHGESFQPPSQETDWGEGAHAIEAVQLRRFLRLFQEHCDDVDVVRVGDRVVFTGRVKNSAHKELLRHLVGGGGISGSREHVSLEIKSSNEVIQEALPDLNSCHCEAL